jgi:hypothetical protein
VAKGDDYLFTITDRDSTGKGRGTARDRAVDTHREATRKDPRGRGGRDERGRFLPGSNAPYTRPVAGNTPGRLRSAMTDVLIGAGAGGAVVADQFEAERIQRMGNRASAFASDDSHLPLAVQQQRKDRARKEARRATRTAAKERSKYVGPLLSRAFGSNIMSIAKDTLAIGTIFAGVRALGEGLETSIIRRQTEDGFSQSRTNLAYESTREAANAVGRTARDYATSGLSNLAAFFQTGGQVAAGGDIRTINQNAMKTRMQFERQLFEVQKKLSELTGGLVAPPGDTPEMIWRKEQNTVHDAINTEVDRLGLSSQRKIAINTSLRLWEMGLDTFTLEMVSRENRRRVAVEMAQRVHAEKARRIAELPRSYLEAIGKDQ